MATQINGIGTTFSPVPSKDCYSISMHWFTFLFIPLIPLGFYLIKGIDTQQNYLSKIHPSLMPLYEQNFTIIKKLTYKEAYRALGIKGILLTFSWTLLTNLLLLVFLALILSIKYWIN